MDLHRKSCCFQRIARLMDRLCGALQTFGLNQNSSYFSTRRLTRGLNFSWAWSALWRITNEDWPTYCSENSQCQQILLRTWQENAKTPEVFDARIDEIKSMTEAVTALRKVSNLAHHYFSQHVQACDHLSGDFDSLQKLLPTHGKEVQWGFLCVCVRR